MGFQIEHVIQPWHNKLQKSFFSGKNTKSDHPIVFLNETPAVHIQCQKHIGMYLDEKLNSMPILMRELQKVNKGIGNKGIVV